MATFRHAGYTYSGPCAAWAYKSLNLSGIKRVFLIGPTHTYGFDACHLSVFSKYKTPFGDFEVDRKTIDALKAVGDAEGIKAESATRGSMSGGRQRGELFEHSLEMQLPYLYMRCEETFESPSNFPTIVPVLIGMPATAHGCASSRDQLDARQRDEKEHREKEKSYAQLFEPYLKDPSNAFIISSDFCHWSDSNFDYSPYSKNNDVNDWVALRSWDKSPRDPPIHKTIETFDRHAMDAVEKGSHTAFCESVRLTGNTICGKHPIGVILAALEGLTKDGESSFQPQVKILHYDRSSLVTKADGHSVSYVAAYATV